MARNALGTYSLPGAVNPVVADTVITANWANTTLSDIEDELTDSLSRSGKGGMLSGAVLEVDEGTEAAPGLGFVQDPDTGLFWDTTGELAVVSNGSEVFRFGATYVESSQPFRFPAGTAAAPGLYPTGDSDAGLFSQAAAGQAGQSLGFGVGGAAQAWVRPDGDSYSFVAQNGAIIASGSGATPSKEDATWTHHPHLWVAGSVTPDYEPTLSTTLMVSGGAQDGTLGTPFYNDFSVPTGIGTNSIYGTFRLMAYKYDVDPVGALGAWQAGGGLEYDTHNDEVALVANGGDQLLTLNDTFMRLQAGTGVDTRIDSYQTTLGYAQAADGATVTLSAGTDGYDGVFHIRCADADEGDIYIGQGGASYGDGTDNKPGIMLLSRSGAGHPDGGGDQGMLYMQGYDRLVMHPVNDGDVELWGQTVIGGGESYSKSGFTGAQSNAMLWIEAGNSGKPGLVIRGSRNLDNANAGAILSLMDASSQHADNPTACMLTHINGNLRFSWTYDGALSPTTTITFDVETGAANFDGAVTDSSDERIKENIEDLEPQSDLLRALRLRRFDKLGLPSMGLIAQEVQALEPGLVRSVGPRHGLDDMLSVNTTELLYRLIAGWQELYAALAELDARTGDLEGMLAP